MKYKPRYSFLLFLLAVLFFTFATTVTGVSPIGAQNLLSEEPLDREGQTVPADLTGHWAREIITAMMEQGIISVEPRQPFHPGLPVSRVDFTQWLVKALNLPLADHREAGDRRPLFTDEAEINPEQLPYVKAAYEAGLLTGYEDGSFRPRRTISRLEIGTLMGRALTAFQLTADTAVFARFADGASIPPWGAPAALAVEQQIIIGQDDQGSFLFAPAAATTRAEAAVMIYRFNAVVAEQGGGEGLGPPSDGGDKVAGRRLVGYYINQDAAYEVLQRHGSALDQLVYWSYRHQADGELQGTDSPRTRQWAAEAQVPLLALLGNHDREVNSLLLNDGQARARSIAAVKELLTDGYQGVNVDFENVAPEDEAVLTSYVCTLYRELKADGYAVDLSLPAKTSDDQTGWAGPFDYAALGECADYVVVMTYDFSWPGGEPGPIGPISWMRRVLSYASEKIPSRRLLLGLPAYGYDWPLDDEEERARSLTARQALQLAARLDIEPEYYAEYGEATFRYEDEEGRQREVWFTPAAGVKAKLALIEEFGLAGGAMWRLGQESDDYWPHLRDLNR